MAALLVLAQGVTALAVAPPAGAPPNVVVVMLDDLDSTLFADALPSLPAISAVKARGASFDRYFATTPLCCPSRASFLRGQYPQNHGVLWNRGDPDGNGGFEAFHRLGRESSTLATWLHDAGYRTGLLGKYLNAYPMGAPADWVPPGWDRWAAHPAERREVFYTDYQLNEDGVLFSYGDAPEDYSTDVLARMATAFVRERADDGRPFFLFVAPYAPHDPATPADRHAGAFADVQPPRSPAWNENDVSDKPEWVQALPPIPPTEQALIDEGYRSRMRTLLAVDELVAGVDAALAETGAAENTVVVIVSDNGFHFGEHRVAWGKVTPYDESTRVPLIVAGPGIAPGSTVDRLAINVDLAPTIAGLAGIETPAFVDGRSLIPVLHGEAPADWRDLVLLRQFEDVSERPARSRRAARAGERERATANPSEGQPPAEMGGAAVSTGGESTPAAGERRRFTQATLPPFAALRGEDYLYVEYATGEREYYDLVTDPAALDNRAGELPGERVQALSARLAALANCAGAGCRSAEQPSISEAS